MNEGRLLRHKLAKIQPLKQIRFISATPICGCRVNERRTDMIDRYTKIVLTVIATALVGLVAQNALGPANAQRGACGSSIDPCYVTSSAHGLNGLSVYVTNWPR